MGILGNFARENQSVRRCYGGGAVSLSRGNLSTNRKSLWWHFIVRDGESTARATVGKPHGYYPSASWRMPRVAGAVLGFASMGLDATGAAAQGVAISGSATIGLDADAIGNLVVSAVGTATIGLDATGSISGVANASGTATIGLDGTASAGGIGYASGTATIGLDGYAECYGIGYCSGTTEEIDALSPEGLAAALWGSLAASYNVAGTMGSKLNAAGSAGDPWGTALPGSYLPGTAGDFLGNCVPDVWRRLGLGDPQTTSRAGTVTTITDGTLTMTVTENPDGSVVVERT